MAFMYQVSTLQALAKGDFYSNATIAELLNHGDIGLGTLPQLMARWSYSMVCAIGRRQTVQ